MSNPGLRRFVRIAVEPLLILTVQDEWPSPRTMHAKADVYSNVPEGWTPFELWLVSVELELPIVAAVRARKRSDVHDCVEALLKAIRETLTEAGGEPYL